MKTTFSFASFRDYVKRGPIFSSTYHDKSLKRIFWDDFLLIDRINVRHTVQSFDGKWAIRATRAWTKKNAKDFVLQKHRNWIDTCPGQRFLFQFCLLLHSLTEDDGKKCTALAKIVHRAWDSNERIGEGKKFEEYRAYMGEAYQNATGTQGHPEKMRGNQQIACRFVWLREWVARNRQSWMFDFLFQTALLSFLPMTVRSLR